VGGTVDGAFPQPTGLACYWCRSASSRCRPARRLQGRASTRVGDVNAVGGPRVAGLRGHGASLALHLGGGQPEWMDDLRAVMDAASSETTQPPGSRKCCDGRQKRPCRQGVKFRLPLTQGGQGVGFRRTNMQKVNRGGSDGGHVVRMLVQPGFPGRPVDTSQGSRQLTHAGREASDLPVPVRRTASGIAVCRWLVSRSGPGTGRLHVEAR
jgi:hypothetical protein